MTADRATQRDLYDTINDFRKEVNGRFDKLEDDFSRKYVPMERFLPVERAVTWAVGVGGLVLMGILALVLSNAIPGFSM